MPPQKPFVPPPEPLNKSKDHYKFQGQPYEHLEIDINLTSLKTLAIATVLGVPYLGLILMAYSSGLKVLTVIMIGTAILLGISIDFYTT
ncbi:MAG: hypothetical protein HC894_04205 [Microcoleus sp. SM1_3_4]|nr:hypothetical protein [Microcoleus sp. SM1_3_4]